MNIRTPVLDWRDYLPFAKAETSKFYRKQERGKFRYEELLSVAVEALATAERGWKKAIKGALTDYVRNTGKLIRNVEMSEDEYPRTWGSPVPKLGRPRVVERKDGVTYYTPGPYLTNYQLLAGDYKVGRHCKVSVEIERSSYNDEWGQTSSGWIRGEIEDDDHDFDPRSARMAQPRGGVDQGDYVGRGRERRFSTICHNHCVDYKSGLAPGGDRRFCDGKVVVYNQNRKTPPVIRRNAVAQPLDVRISGRQTSRVIVDLKKFGLEPVPADKLGHWREELAMEPRLRAGSSLISWHREAGHFEVEWGFPSPTGPDLIHYGKIFLPKPEKVPDWADILTTNSLEQDVPRRPALGSASPLVVLREAEPPSFVPDGEMRTQRPAGIIATAREKSIGSKPEGETATEPFLEFQSSETQGSAYAK